MGDRKVAERRWTDVEHIALAEKQLEDAYRAFDKPDPLTAAILAAAHGAVALLASRPTTPDNELVRRAMQGVTGDLLDENKRLWAENERLRTALIALGEDRVCATCANSGWIGSRSDPTPCPGCGRKPYWLVGDGTYPAPEPSTGEDQSAKPERSCSRCSHGENEHDMFQECDVFSCNCGLFVPVTDEGSETDG